MIMTGEAASAGGELPGDEQGQAMAEQINQDVSSYVPTDASGAPGAAMGGMMSQISQSVSSNVSMAGVASPQAAAGGAGAPLPQIDLQQMIAQAIQAMPQQQRDQLAAEMAGQNLSLLQQGNAVASQLRDKVRDQIMKDRYAGISQVAPTKFRSSVQPMMVQQMIGNIRPWEFPGKFKSVMMPPTINLISGQVKPQQLGHMQDGIGSSAFPNIPGVPANVIEQVGGQVKEQQMKQMQESIMNSSFPNISQK
jgi:hypothetical protein